MLNIKASKAFDKPKEKTKQLSKWGDRILRADEAYNVDELRKQMRNEKKRIQRAKKKMEVF